MNRFLVLLLAVLLTIPATVFADPTVEELQAQIADILEELDDLSDRLEGPEKHTAMDRISFTGDLRNTVDSLHYKNVVFSPGMKVRMPMPGNPVVEMPMINPNTGTPFFPLEKRDIDNDLMYTTRLRLNMKADIASNMNFSGRLAMYKNWGDSTSTNVFDSWDAFAMDGTSSGKTSGDLLKVERAFFNWKDIGGSDIYFSIGRRPSTYGPPSNFRVNELRGGTPSGHLVDFNFDGLTIGYHLDKITGIEGQTIRFCYGQGFESDWGNGSLINSDINDNLEDTHLGGFNIDLFNDGQTFVQMTLFRAQDVVDGFKGEFAFPDAFVDMFTTYISQDTAEFPNMNFNVRYTPSTVIGDINLAQIGFTREEDNGFVWFGSVGWTQLDSNGNAGMFGGMGNDMVYEPVFDGGGNMIGVSPTGAQNDDTQDGYGVYVGIRTPAPMGKFGLEYNYGSEYWTPFTQAQDDLLGSKLSTRGHVVEAYYIFDINPNAFIKVGGLYYDYEYSGSGSPVGEPKKIDDIMDGTAYSLLPVVDTAWDAYAKITMKF